MKQTKNLPAVQVQRMTSLEIAELTGKQHKNVMQAIRNMEAAWEKACGLKFQLTSRTIVQPNGGTREVPCYQLTKTECLYIATKFNDEARAKLVIRWYELEQERLKREGVRMLMVTDEDVVHEADVITGRTLVSFNQHADGCITAKDIAQTMGGMRAMRRWSATSLCTSCCCGAGRSNHPELSPSTPTIGHLKRWNKSVQRYKEIVDLVIFSFFLFLDVDFC